MFYRTLPRLQQFSKNAGIMRRSLEYMKFETKKILSGGYLNPDFEDLYFFNAEDHLTRERIDLMSDAIDGGQSKADFAIVSEDNFVSAIPPKPISMSNPDYEEYKPKIPTVYGLFHGNISKQLPNQIHRPDVEISGFAAFRTQHLPKTIFGARTYDLGFYEYIALRVKSDGRTYMVNMQADTYEERDLYQHRLFTRKPGQWETVVLKNGAFVKTMYGGILLEQPGMLVEKVRTIGLSVTDRVEGPFKIAIHAIWATNTPPPDSVDATIVDGKEEYLDWEHNKHRGDRVW
ncbi:hypothetical protein TWF730_001433 [Orbilia blumenaviensis]|uniref:NADH:ubiquinone oxidoreductase intermediate-associated protein 30 domain-containing protein n=1 Tax=Orbilia blumenaviensis TaxID=1796055 RepID=A0AAV9UHV7_9PEZI